jgi:hypothetical protein
MTFRKYTALIILEIDSIVRCYFYRIHFQYIVFIDLFAFIVDTRYFHRVTLHRNNTAFSKNGNVTLRLLAHQPASAEKIRLHPSPKRRPGSTEVGEFFSRTCGANRAPQVRRIHRTPT